MNARIQVEDCCYISLTVFIVESISCGSNIQSSSLLLLDPELTGNASGESKKLRRKGKKERKVKIESSST